MNIGSQLDDQYLKAKNIIAAADKELLGEDESNLLETWNCFKEGLLGRAAGSALNDSYLANCLHYLEARKYVNIGFLFRNELIITPTRVGILMNIKKVTMMNLVLLCRKD